MSVKKPGFTVWRPGFLDHARKFILSASFQASAQLTIGMLVVNLFSFVRPMIYSYSCLATTLYVVCSILAAQDSNAGSKVLASGVVLGSVIFGCTLSGTMISLAQIAFHNGGCYIAAMLILASFGLSITVVNRVALDPPYLAPMGMISTLAFGLCSASGSPIHPNIDMWHNVVGHLIADAAIAAGVTILSGTLVLPTFAAHELQACVAKAIRGMGHTASRHASRIFAHDVHAPATNATLKALPAASPAFLDPEPKLSSDPASSVVVLTSSAAAKQGSGSDEGGAVMVRPPSGSTLGMSGEMGEGGSVMSIPSKDRLSGLESSLVYEAGEVMTSEEYISMLKAAAQVPLKPSKTPPHFNNGHIMASHRAALGRARACIPGSLAEPAFMSARPFDAARWGRVIGASDALLTALEGMELMLEGADPTLHDSFFVEMLTMDVLPPFRLAFGTLTAACAQAAADVACYPTPMKAHAPHDWKSVRAELRMALDRGMAGYWMRIRKEHATHPESGVIRIASAEQIRALMFAWHITNTAISAMENLQAAIQALHAPGLPNNPPPQPGAPPHPPNTGVKRWIFAHFFWLIMWLTLASAVPIFKGLVTVYTTEIPALFRPGGLMLALKSRRFQMAAKYWAALSIIVLLIVGLTDNPNTPEVTQYKPIFGVVAASISFTGRVEATVSNIAMWVFGTIFGGLLGFLAMLRVNFATNPEGLIGVICTFTFIVGLLSDSRWKTPSTLTLMTMAGMITCQYDGAHPGQASTFYARVLAVICGTLTAVLISNLIFPWYTSHWAMSTMMGIFSRSSTLLASTYDSYYNQGKGLAEAAEALRASKKRPSDDVVEEQDDRVLVSMECKVAPGPPPPSPVAVQMIGPLTAVQMNLVKEVAWWHHGLLSTPPVLNRLLLMLYELAARMNVLHTCIGKPVEGARFTGGGFTNIVVPIDAPSRDILHTAGELTRAVAAFVEDPTPEAKTKVKEILDELYLRRDRIRREVCANRLKFHAYVSTMDPKKLPDMTNSDDVVRIFSFIYALIKVMNKVTQIGNLVVCTTTKSEMERETSWVK